MEIIGLILGFAAALLGFPIGLFLAKIAKEEIDNGKKYFKKILAVLAIIFVLTMMFYFIFGIELTDLAIIIDSIIFIAGIALAALMRAK